MKVSGDSAKKYQVIQLSSMRSLAGTIVEADDQLGIATMVDKTGEQKTYEFGPHRIKIILKYK